MKKILLLLFVYCQLLLSLPQDVFSQAPQSWTSSDIGLALRKLNVLGSVLYVAAHPDDENTRLIAYFSKDKLYRTGYLSITRGDGGQNLIGDEQGIELGLIRTQELLAARRIDGGEQFFSRAFDFGYSKNPEETFAKWDKEKILSDVVWVIRKFQPDIIITRFPTTGEGGHGHHTASAILAQEAFVAAADSTRFREQLEHVQPWQAQRVLWNTFSFGSTNTITADQFKIDVGGYNPLLGKSYGEIAAESRSQHKSQGFGVPASRGESFESFKTTAGTAPVNDVMDGVNLSWARIAGGEAIEKKANGLIAAFDLLHPEKSVEGLVNLYKDMSKLPDGYWRNQKLQEVKKLIGQCSGLFIDATTTEQFAVQTDSIRINFSVNNRLGVDAKLERIMISGLDSSFSRALEKNKNVNFAKTFYVPSSHALTQPYWLEDKMEEGYFNVKNPLQIGQPDVDAAYNVLIELKIFGEPFSFTRPVTYKYTDPVNGELYQPLYVIAPTSITTMPSINMVRKGKQKEINFSVKTYKTLSGGFEVTDTGDSINQYASLPGQLNKGSNHDLQIKTGGVNEERGGYIGFKGVADSRYENGFSMIVYNHIPSILVPTTSQYLVKPIQIDIAGKKIGYITGAGDKVPGALEQMGYEVTLLTDKELLRNNLQQFDAIISGIRAYNTNEWLNKYYDKLMKYVNEGGNYIVQYNTINYTSNVKNKVGPYDFTIGRTRVTDENAAVSFLKPGHAVLNFPNKITPDDFKGWVQERSIYNASNWDKNFEAIFSMNDAGEKADDGSLIIAKHGKGYFTYTGLVFFRELPAGVPGAYRLLANLIALNKLRVQKR